MPELIFLSFSFVRADTGGLLKAICLLKIWDVHENEGKEEESLVLMHAQRRSLTDG